MLPTLFALQLILAVGDTCDHPVEGEYGDPTFCLVMSDTTVETDHFSIQIPAHWLYGLADGGVRVLKETRQTAGELAATIVPKSLESRLEARRRTGHKCSPSNTPFTGWYECVLVTNGEGSLTDVFKLYPLHGGQLLEVQYSYPTERQDYFEPVFRSVADSIRLR